MKRILLASASIAACMLGAGLGAGNALAETELEEIVVKTNFNTKNFVNPDIRVMDGQVLLTAPVNVTVVDRERFNLDTVNYTDTRYELMTRVPGMTNVRNLRIPCGWCDYTVNLQNGMATQPLGGGSFNFNEANNFDIERVEIIKGRASALCTGPIHKKALYEGAGFAFPGHTEFLADLAGVSRVVMMLAAPGLRVVPVTIHMALSEVPGALNAGLLRDTIAITARALHERFGIGEPRLAVSGLNPHAGEGGAMGHEDAEVIAPVIEALRAKGMAITGPLPADTMFHADARARYDAAICMYHDQALIPLKTLDFHGGVNITLGLPFIRTSPDHGTALDIAGSGRANPASLIAALRMAHEMAAA